MSTMRAVRIRDFGPGSDADRVAHAHRARGVGFLVQPNAAQLAELARLIDESKLRPIVCACYS